jgi:hypothetical protein
LFSCKHRQQTNVEEVQYANLVQVFIDIDFALIIYFASDVIGESVRGVVQFGCVNGIFVRITVYRWQALHLRQAVCLAKAEV